MLELSIKVHRGVRVLCEDNDFILSVFLIQKVIEALNLLVVIGIPDATEFNHLDNGLGILLEILFQGPFEILWLKPRDIILELDGFIMLFG